MIKNKKKFIQSALSKMKRKGTLGSFKRWCKRNGLLSKNGKVTKKCILVAKKSSNLKIRRKAIFAQNIDAFEKKNTKKNTKKYSTAGGRKSPGFSATKFPRGTRKKGLDGNIWVIRINTNGVKRWSKN